MVGRCHLKRSSIDGSLKEQALVVFECHLVSHVIMLENCSLKKWSILIGSLGGPNFAVRTAKIDLSSNHRVFQAFFITLVFKSYKPIRNIPRWF